MHMLQVLTVEDDVSTQRLFGALITREGWEQIAVHDGIDALERLLSEPAPDVIILDLMLPRLSGFEVLRQLRTSAPELLPRVIVITSLPKNDLRLYDATIPVWKFVRKPFDVLKLCDTMRICAAQALFGPGPLFGNPAQLPA